MSAVQLTIFFSFDIPRTCLPTQTQWQTPIYTPWAIKTCHFIFHYNSRISWPIFTLFIPMETGQNTVQYSHLKDWWRHNRITLQCSVYRVTLCLIIKCNEMEWGNMLSSEDKILINTRGNRTDFLPEDSSRNTLTTRSSAIAEGLRDVLCQSKYWQQLPKNHIARSRERSWRWLRVIRIAFIR